MAKKLPRVKVLIVLSGEDARDLTALAKKRSKTAEKKVHRTDLMRDGYRHILKMSKATII